jgi:hypothetical protein
MPKPFINARHIDGPMLAMSDDQVHWLSPWERLLFWLGLTDAATLDAKYRGKRFLS